MRAELPLRCAACGRARAHGLEAAEVGAAVEGQRPALLQDRRAHAQERALDRAGLLLRLDEVEREEHGGGDEAAERARHRLRQRLEARRGLRHGQGVVLVRGVGGLGGCSGV